MDKCEAIRQVVARMEVIARCIHQDTDGDATYVPDANDLDILSALVGRIVTEEDLHFQVGAGPYRTKFTVSFALLNELSAQFREARTVLGAALHDTCVRCGNPAPSDELCSICDKEVRSRVK